MLCSAWNDFKKVKEFAAFEETIKGALVEHNIAPQAVPDLSLKHLCYLLCEKQKGDKRGDDEIESVRILEESYKAKHTKRFINENEQEFRAGMLTMKGVDPEYVERLIAIMKEGRTDLSGEKDSFGNPKWDGQPVIDVHHIINIKDASTEEKFASVNNYSNMCFIVRHPQHDAMHALENDVNGRYRNDIFHSRPANEEFVFRIQPPEGAKCIFGFNHVLYDKEYLKAEEKNKKAAEIEAAKMARKNAYINRQAANNPKHFKQSRKR